MDVSKNTLINRVYHGCF